MLADLSIFRVPLHLGTVQVELHDAAYRILRIEEVERTGRAY